MACETRYDAKTRIWSGAPEDFDSSQQIGAVLLDNLRSRGDKIMQIFDDTMESMTAAELYKRSIKLAVQFRLHGIQAGDVVSFHVQHLPDSTPMVVALFAVGAVLNALDRNNLCTPSPDRSFLRMVQPKYIICHVDMLEEVKRHAEDVNCSAEFITFEACDGKYASVEEFLLKDSAEEDDFVLPVIEDTDTTAAVILASSGTTGAPKAICLSHSLLLSQIMRCTLNKDVGVMFNPSPIDWISGFDNFIGSMYRGKTRIICRLPITAERFVEIVKRHEVTDTFCDPSRMYELDRVLQANGECLSSVQLLVCSGTLASEQLQLKILECFPNAGVAVGYGLTELGGLATASLMGQRGFSVGFLLRGIHIRVSDANGEPMGPGEVGDLYVRGSHPLMRGPQCESAQPIDTHEMNKWITTDDVGYFDEDGFLFIVGRKGDQLMFKHHVVRPLDIESVMEQHDDVQRAAVVGVSVPIYNDIPAAVCVRKPESSVCVMDLQQWLKDKLPETHQLRGGIYFVDELPLTSTGKVRKVVCKELAFRLYHEQITFAT